jgi:hypothetical protein
MLHRPAASEDDMDEIERMEAALRAAVAAHRVELQQRIEAEASGFELRFLFARLGLTPAELDLVAAAAQATALPAALRETLRQRLAAETARLLRLARARSPAYDLNRHIAVRRAVGWVEARLVPVIPTAPGIRRSGYVLNGRFRDSRRHRAPAPSPTDAGSRLPTA